ncbi:GNAT family N-acetyltransferase [Horticoccus sp. 23ND18S-11]|uniref:GNAT family N-acetyltransferase n=1 Tax=Horticoccus sp. 23ND18S-11 TaxID=3391832 RepID=UPI0039C9AF5C
MNPLVFPVVATGRYELSLAEDLDDVRAVQRLRFRIFNLELHEGLAEAYATGLDADAFDEVCDHLLVRDRETNSVVGTYRLQTGRSAAAHRGYYSAQEFEFHGFEPVRDQLVELGRACVAAEHRNLIVLNLLWRGIARYAQSHGARYLTGCSSLTTQDEAAALATYNGLAGAHLVEARLQTRPRSGWRCSASTGRPVALPIPKLLRAYLALGAKICGEPAIDRDFGTVDFLTWIDVQSIPVRTLRTITG